MCTKGHFTHETECPWLLHSKYSHWWKRWSRSNFTSHYAWGTNGITKVYFQKPPLGDRPNTKLGDHGILNVHNRWFLLFYNVWAYAWIKIHWNIIWLRVWSHVTSHYTWGYVTTLHDFGGVLGWPLDTFFWALTISWSWLLARVWSGPNSNTTII